MLKGELEKKHSPKVEYKGLHVVLILIKTESHQ